MRPLLPALLLTFPSVPATAAAADPWPAAPVLTRLLTLPAGHADGQRLVRDLKLTSVQVAELRRLAGSEAAYGRAGRQVIGRDEAARLNRNLHRMTLEKDRKVRLVLAAQYPAFRAWVRTWWQTQVGRARS
ncbi:hypothetical protein [Deinococcus hohokamensis]|uniref:Uncharacterized protein n=1 Tax=Deinococcus hohokamensis TaxID=309883 RepID=A0ABV9IB94_9DEIO